jgi:hypothetical protein
MHLPSSKHFAADDASCDLNDGNLLGEFNRYCVACEPVARICSLGSSDLTLPVPK